MSRRNAPVSSTSLVDENPVAIPVPIAFDAPRNGTAPKVNVQAKPVLTREESLALSELRRQQQRQEEIDNIKRSREAYFTNPDRHSEAEARDRAEYNAMRDKLAKESAARAEKERAEENVIIDYMKGYKGDKGSLIDALVGDACFPIVERMAKKNNINFVSALDGRGLKGLVTNIDDEGYEQSDLSMLYFARSDLKAREFKAYKDACDMMPTVPTSAVTLSDPKFPAAKSGDSLKLPPVRGAFSRDDRAADSAAVSGLEGRIATDLSSAAGHLDKAAKTAARGVALMDKAAGQFDRHEAASATVSDGMARVVPGVDEDATDTYIMGALADSVPKASGKFANRLNKPSGTRTR